ncbi:TetR/AcrR family transcriptional regulator [Serinicoccus marinus]|uniref:TetR/AcrR family transcriptional regulator n=1 Tax=Serinicoccus marinus TaxID=247333 RepID=UPI0003B32578|nr:TetR/AcrR family transcriptional regulator [Serinicoccus marinus]
MRTDIEPQSARAPVARDGRDARWEAHRTERRHQLVEAALKAIRQHGAGVGMDEIAAQAGTSKTVLYRHLGDKAGLYSAVVAAVDETVLGDLAAASRQGGDVLARIQAMVHSYLSLVERDPEIYRFVMTRPLETTEGDPDDPVHRITDRVSDQLAGAIRTHLTQHGRGAEADLLAPAWGHGIVGLVRAAADHVLTSTSTTRLSVDDATHAVIELIRPALAGENR